MKQRPFRDRREAGQLLATKLTAYANRPDVLVLALPRGGVPVAYEVSRTLGAPRDIFLVRKLGVPGYEELAMGAIATGGVRVLNDELVGGLRIPDYVIDEVAAWDEARWRSTSPSGERVWGEKSDCTRVFARSYRQDAKGNAKAAIGERD